MTKGAEKFKQVVFEAVVTALAHAWKKTAMHPRLDMLVEQHWADKRTSSPNPLVKAGQKYYSQNDEDGITLEIFRRLAVRSGVFVEFGVGSGLENNTLVLLMNDWRGVWIGGEDLEIVIPAASRKLQFSKAWVTRDNCVDLMAHGLSRLGVDTCDFLSIDLDGNDFYVAEAILRSGIRPSVIVVEYNAKFPPPVRWTIEYDPDFRWANDDYVGASLQAFVDLFAGAGYRLACCNVTGLNAYFVSDRFEDCFADVPRNIAELFVPPDYAAFVSRGHPPSSRTIERLL